MRKNLNLFVLVIIFILLSGFGCKCVSSNTASLGQDVTLEYWRVWDESETFQTIINEYNALHPFVNVNYKLIRYEEYEQKLLEAFASDQVPDIFSIHNTWTRKYQSRDWIAPMPDTTTMLFTETRGTIKKELVPVVKTQASPTLNDIKSEFVDVVYDDVVISVKDGQTKQVKNYVYGLPVAVDTLLMFVNRDLLNNAGITDIPSYWDTDFQQTVRKLTKQNNKGEIIQSGVALGGSENIERSSDILSALMMQNGTEMMDLTFTNVTISKTPDDYENISESPGEDALRFYTDFANPAKEVYCWNGSMDNSLDLFIRGKLAIMFGYSYMIPQIEAGNPKMNLVVTRFPQIQGNTPVNFANYWVESVASKSRHQNEAWDFILFATQAQNAINYLDATRKTTALRSLVNVQKEELDLEAYVDQVLTAKSWYKGNDANSAEQAMKDMITNVLSGEVEMRKAIKNTEKKVQQTINASLLND
ncbi:hypothetical protein C0583_05905 [Candidatus Parcubacteria bacterium]|nr:MAG: hypothetical protein C0583_05905 [Candidatus Parcubacteria bacterium]